MIMIVLFRSIMFFLYILEFLVLLRVLMSWLLMLGSSNSVSKFVFELTDFMFIPARKLLNKTPFGRWFIDFSPILVWFEIELAKVFFAVLFGFFI